MRVNATSFAADTLDVREIDAEMFEELDPAKSHLPLILLDVDGVLNAFSYSPAETSLPDTAFSDLTEYNVWNEAHGRSYRFWVSPELIADIRAIHDSGLTEIAWLTSWRDEANTQVAPTLGLPRFPVVGYPRGISDYSWKQQTAMEALWLGRPVAWLDDDEILYPASSAFDEAPFPTLTISPDPRVGLTRADIDDILRFIQRD